MNRQIKAVKSLKRLDRRSPYFLEKFENRLLGPTIVFNVPPRDLVAMSTTVIWSLVTLAVPYPQDATSRLAGRNADQFAGESSIIA